MFERLVLDAFADADIATRVEVAARTGLSRGIISGVVGALVARGELVPAAAPRSGGSRGRPSLGYRRAAVISPVALVRLRHHGQASVALIGVDRRVVAADLPVPWTSPWASWAPQVAAGLAALRDGAGASPRAVVLALPFPVGHGRAGPLVGSRPAAAAPLVGSPPAATAPLVPSRPAPAAPAARPDPLPDWLSDRPADRAARLLGCPAQLANDANLAALGEARYGAARGHRTVLHLSVRDGIGAGLVLDGTLFTGAHGLAGEMAHVQVVEGGPFCGCGNRGCLATQTLDPLVVDALTSRYDRPLSFTDVERMVARGDPLAVRFFTELGGLVGRPLATVVSMLAPDALVLDAALGAAGEQFRAGLEAELAARCPPALLAEVAVVGGELADAVALGAYAAADRVAGSAAASGR